MNQPSMRERVTEDELKKFHVVHGDPKRDSGRRSERVVQLEPTRFEIGDKPLLLDAAQWEEVKALAAKQNFGVGNLDYTPRSGLAFASALFDSLAGSMSEELRYATQLIIRMAKEGRGLKVTAKYK